MSNCPNCGAPIAPNSRFCTECGKPVAAAGPAPMPPVPPTGAIPAMPPTGMPPMPPTQGARPMPPTGMPPVPPTGAIPTMPPAPGPGARPPVPGPGGFAPVPPTPGPAPVPGPAPAPIGAAPVPGPAHAPQAAAAVFAGPATEPFQLASVGDLLNNGTPVAILVTESQLTVLQPGANPIVEQIPGLRHAIVGDFDGDSYQELAVFNESQVWVLRFGAHGSVPSGKVTLKEVPAYLVKAPFTHDGGRTVLMSATAEQITFYVLHPSKGLVEIGKTTVPPIEP